MPRNDNIKKKENMKPRLVVQSFLGKNPRAMEVKAGLETEGEPGYHLRGLAWLGGLGGCPVRGGS